MTVITPSSPDLWHGTPKPGSIWTAEQARYLADPRVNWRGEKFAVTVETSRIDREMMIAVPGKAKVLCPVLRTTGRGRYVVTPCGLPKWIDKKGENV